MLHGNSYWGFHPKLDLSSVHLPQLQTLALGRLAFDSNSQFRLIIEHGRTLRGLYLRDCLIITEVKIRASFVSTDREGYVERLSNGDGDRRLTRLWRQRWAEDFGRFAKEMNKLEVFRLSSKDCGRHWKRESRGTVPNTEQSDIWSYTDMATELDDSRYVRIEGAFYFDSRHTDEKPDSGISVYFLQNESNALKFLETVIEQRRLRYGQGHIKESD